MLEAELHFNQKPGLGTRIDAAVSKSASLKKQVAWNLCLRVPWLFGVLLYRNGVRPTYEVIHNHGITQLHMGSYGLHMGYYISYKSLTGMDIQVTSCQSVWWGHHQVGAVWLGRDSGGKSATFSGENKVDWRRKQLLGFNLFN